MVGLVEEVLLRGATRLHGLLAREERGQALAEYSLIITVVAVGAIPPATIVFRTQLAAAFTSVVDCIAGTTC